MRRGLRISIHHESSLDRRTIRKPLVRGLPCGIILAWNESLRDAFCPVISRASVHYELHQGNQCVLTKCHFLLQLHCRPDITRSDITRNRIQCGWSMDLDFITDLLRCSTSRYIILNISKCAVAYGFVTIQTTYDVC